MRPTRITQTGAGTSTPVVLDIYDRSQISLAVAVSASRAWRELVERRARS